MSESFGQQWKPLWVLMALAMAAISVPAAAASPAAARIVWFNRLTWGVTPAAMASGDDPTSDRWLNAQLHTANADLPPEAAAQVAKLMISRVPMTQLVVDQEASAKAANAQTDPAVREASRQAYQKAMNLLAEEARTRTLLRALYAPDQLREQMGWFWFNLFNVHVSKRDVRAMVGDYDQLLHDRAFGRFRDILEATLKHPAMLRYLDNDQNAANHINENYAREIMELHSMGVGSGYSQQDVQELAKILTGVGVRLDPNNPKLKPEWQPLYVREGLFEFNPARHDFSTKHFLGHEIKGSGFGEVEQALDLIAASPATAHHVSLKLATYFAGDNPAPAMVDRMVATFQRSHGDMAEVVHTMVRSREFAASLGHAFKDPMHYVISAIRLAYGDRVILNTRNVVEWTSRLGENLYNHETPDGYPLESAAWSGPGQMATRFDIARLIGREPFDLFKPADGGPERPAFPVVQNALYFGGLAETLSPTTRTALDQARNVPEWNALFLSSPEFMRR